MMEKDNLKRINKIFIFLILLLCAFNYSNVKAADEYLPITYKTVRYTGGQWNNPGTTIWYSKIPAKYKMHYAYGKDKINSQEKPSENALRHKATLAVNTQYMGLADYNGTLLGEGTDVSKYDFYMKPNTDDSISNVAHLYAVSKTSTEIGINLAYAKNPIWSIGMSFVTMYRDGNRVHEDENNLQEATYNNLVNNRHPRTWIVIDSEGNQYVAVATGRQPDANPSQEGLTFEEIVDATKQFLTTDIKYLYNLDGGRSSSFVYHGNMLNPKLFQNPNESEYEERLVRGIFYWKVDNYNISYDLKGGTISNNKTNPTKYNVDTETITLNNPTKTGYKFLGWTGDNGDTPQKTVTITTGTTGNKSYAANWEKNVSTYTVSFDSNGGSDVEEITFTEDGHINEPPTPKKEGYKFVGWYEDKNFTKKFDFSKLPTSDITLYAKWEKVSENGSNKENVEESIVAIPNTGIKGPMVITITIGLVLVLVGGTIVYKNIKVKEKKRNNI